MKRALVVFVGVLSVIAIPMVGSAHNVGHFTLNGSCHQIGSVKEAPLVGPDRTQLDLVPETANPPRDEYGTSFVGFNGNTPILPGACPSTLSDMDTAAVPGFATISFQ